MVVYSLTATCGRHKSLERCVGMFLDQDYWDDHTLLIYNNSEVLQDLGEIKLLPNKHILLINNCIDLSLGTGGKYTNLGAIYRDMLKYVPENCDLVNFMDDDDLFYPNHISEGVKGFIRGSKEAYKPLYSLYRTKGKLEKVNNTLEPSIFVSFKWLKKYGFSETTSDQHLQWVLPLVHQNQIFADPEGKQTMIYNWGDDYYAFKTSGDMKNPNNFENYRKNSQDHGDRIISPTKFKLP
jgi:hypothetical protein